jgi:hypothetical protein
MLAAAGPSADPQLGEQAQPAAAAAADVLLLKKYLHQQSFLVERQCRQKKEQACMFSSAKYQAQQGISLCISMSRASPAASMQLLQHTFLSTRSLVSKHSHSHHVAAAAAVQKRVAVEAAIQTNKQAHTAHSQRSSYLQQEFEVSTA